MQFDSKSTFLLVHPGIQFALQSADETIERTSAVEIGPLNENNKRQLWLLEGRKGGSFEIINGFTDHVLTEHDGKLILKRGNGSSGQTWQLDFQGETVTIRHARQKGKVLIVENGSVILKEGGRDTWQLQPVTRNDLLSRSCFIQSVDTQLLVDVPEASSKQGEQVGLYNANYRFNQRWNIYRAGEIYVIKSFHSGLNLDVSEERYEEDAKIIQYSSHGGINQFWRFELLDEAKKTYRIYTCYDPELELAHRHRKLVLHKGRNFAWVFEGFFP